MLGHGMTGLGRSSRIHCSVGKLLSSSVEGGKLCDVRVGIDVGENLLYQGDC